MSIDIFNTHVLSKVVEKLERPSSFLLDVFSVRNKPKNPKKST